MKILSGRNFVCKSMCLVYLSPICKVSKVCPGGNLIKCHPKKTKLVLDSLWMQHYVNFDCAVYLFLSMLEGSNKEIES